MVAHNSMATVVNGKAYCVSSSNAYTVCCYDPSQDNWSLSLLPVRVCGLGQVNGKLVAIEEMRGQQTSKAKIDIYTYDQLLETWKITIPPMTVQRFTVGKSNVLSFQSALVVTTCNRYKQRVIIIVNIFKPDTSSQWYTTHITLPPGSNISHLSLVAVDDTCYLLGGHKVPLLYLFQALYATIDDLFHKAVPAHEYDIAHDVYDSHSLWKTLPDTPTDQPIAAVLAGHLLAVGGKEISTERADTKKVYVYSPSCNAWIYMSDLPTPRSNTIIAVLSSTEILVIGGTYRDNEVATVYKGTVTF